MIKQAKLSSYDKKLLQVVEKLEKSATRKFTDLYNLVTPGNDFFENNIVMSKDAVEQSNRLEILRRVYELVNEFLEISFLFD